MRPAEGPFQCTNSVLIRVLDILSPLAVVCIDPESDSEDLLRKPKRPAMPDFKDEEEELYAPRDRTVMDEIFEHSRQRFMEALTDVKKEVDGLAVVKEAWEKAMSGKTTREMDAGMILWVSDPLPTKV